MLTQTREPPLEPREDPAAAHLHDWVVDALWATPETPDWVVELIVDLYELDVSAVVRELRRRYDASHRREE